jgi:hypothetical protein
LPAADKNWLRENTLDNMDNIYSMETKHAVKIFFMSNITSEHRGAKKSETTPSYHNWYYILNFVNKKKVTPET